jgi:hypothetical protein
MTEYFVKHNEELENEIADAMKPIMRDIFRIEIKYVNVICGDDATKEEFDQAIRYVAGLFKKAITSGDYSNVIDELLEEEEL